MQFRNYKSLQLRDDPVSKLNNVSTKCLLLINSWTTARICSSDWIRTLRWIQGVRTSIWIGSRVCVKAMYCGEYNTFICNSERWDVKGIFQYSLPSTKLILTEFQFCLWNLNKIEMWNSNSDCLCDWKFDDKSLVFQPRK